MEAEAETFHGTPLSHCYTLDMFLAGDCIITHPLDVVSAEGEVCIAYTSVLVNS